MKKSLMFLSTALLAFSMVFMSACSDDDGDGKGVEVKASPLKTVGVVYEGDGVETFEFIYDANGRVTSINNIWTAEGEEPDEPSVIEFDYTVANELTITRNGGETVYAIDADNRITKEYWNEEKTEWLGYVYNSDGFMTNVVEHYDGEDHDKWLIDVSNGNVIRHTRFRDDGTASFVKEFTFITSGAGNVSALQQTNIVDSQWKVVGGFYGKASKRLVSALNYWDGVGEEANVRTTTITYPVFDEEGRITTMVRSGSDWSESFTYSYYDVE
jgi:hypothetical protein